VGGGPPMAANTFPFAASDYAVAAQPMLAIGSQMGRAAIGHYLPFASALWHSLRYYFEVNNSYVKNKLRVLLFPFRHKQWNRLSAGEGGSRHETGVEVGCVAGVQSLS
jgi:hypothetical protein